MVVCQFFHLLSNRVISQFTFMLTYLSFQIISFDLNTYFFSIKATYNDKTVKQHFGNIQVIGFSLCLGRHTQISSDKSDTFYHTFKIYKMVAISVGHCEQESAQNVTMSRSNRRKKKYIAQHMLSSRLRLILELKKKKCE